MMRETEGLEAESGILRFLCVGPYGFKLHPGHHFSSEGLVASLKLSEIMDRPGIHSELSELTDTRACGQE